MIGSNFKLHRVQNRSMHISSKGTYSTWPGTYFIFEWENQQLKRLALNLNIILQWKIVCHEALGQRLNPVSSLPLHTSYTSFPHCITFPMLTEWSNFFVCDGPYNSVFIIYINPIVFQYLSCFTLSYTTVWSIYYLLFIELARNLYIHWLTV